MVTCPSCGEENPKRARFCLACAAPLRAPAREGEERKVVSVVFVDLAGFTAASEQSDPEDVRATLRAYHSRVKQELERFGGTVEKFVGDAVMAVFGAPTAHEDDAERAVRVALEIVDAVEELGLSVRAAVNTGEALVALGARPAEGEGFVTGDVVNTASRLQGAAPVGGVVVGESTHRATKGAIEYEELEPVQLKGKAERVHLWRALRARSRLGVDLEPARRTPFLGRDHELAQLKETFLRAERERAVQLVTVTGEPGVGKSRLVAEFRTWLDERAELVRWRQGRCLPYGEGITFWALSEVVKAHSGILESDSAERALEKLREALEETQDREWLVTRLAPLVGAEAAEASRSESFTAWRRFLEGLAAERPLVLAIEDLHWADRALVEFLEHLVDWGSDVPMLVLCSARPELYERHAGWGGGKRNSTTISLSPLSPEDTTRLVGSLLEQAVLPADTQAALLERGGGNPLYTVEFVHMLVDSGALDERGRIATADIAVPETVQALIAARLDTLPADRKALLHDAAVLGKVFWTGALAAMDERDGDQVDAGLRDLVRKELVRPARTSSVEGDAEFSFWHASIRDVAYGQIPRPARARKHASAAEWIENVTPDNAEVLAYHSDQALRFAEAAGAAELADAFGDRARQFAYEAGERVRELDPAAAERYFERSLELSEPGSSESAWARLRLLQTRLDLGSLAHDAIEAELEDVERLFGKVRDERGRAAALSALASFWWMTGEEDAAARRLAQALEIQRRLPRDLELARSLALDAFRTTAAGEPALAIEKVEEGLALCRELELVDWVTVSLLTTLGYARISLADAAGLDDARAALRYCEEHSLDLAGAYGNLASTTWFVEGPGQSLELQRRAVAEAERLGQQSLANHMRAETTWTLYELGEWDELLRVADDVLEREQSRGLPAQAGLIVQTMRAQVLAWRGRSADAAAIVADVLPRARRSALQVHIPALGTAVLVAHAEGDLEAAVGHTAELEREQSSRTALFFGVGHPDAVRACAAAGALELAERLVGGMNAGAPRARHTEVTCRAILAEARGETAAALELYRDAAERWRAWPFVIEEAVAELGAARCGGAAADAGPLFAPLGISEPIALAL